MIARELTKLHEEIVHLRAADARTIEIISKGEFTVVLGPHDVQLERADVATDEDIAAFFGEVTDSSGMSRRAALAATGRRFGLSTNEVYRRLERIKAGGVS